MLVSVQHQNHHKENQPKSLSKWNIHRGEFTTSWHNCTSCWDYIFKLTPNFSSNQPVTFYIDRYCIRVEKYTFHYSKAQKILQWHSSTSVYVYNNRQQYRLSDTVLSFFTPRLYNITSIFIWKNQVLIQFVKLSRLECRKKRSCTYQKFSEMHTS